MKIIARSGERYLVKVNDTDGQIADFETKVLYPTHRLDSILARGYWEDFEGTPELLSEIQSFARHFG